jgi:hypothetical protein
MKTKKIRAALYNSAYTLQQKFNDVFFDELGLYFTPPPRWVEKNFFDAFIRWYNFSISKIKDYAKNNEHLSFVYWENELKTIKEAIEECEFIEIQFSKINDFCEKMRNQ